MPRHALRLAIRGVNMTTDGKPEHLIACVDLTRPELAEVRGAADPAAAFATHLAGPSRARFRFEYERKAEMLAFLKEHYAAWRDFDTSAADRVAGMSIEEAQEERALREVAELGKAWWSTGDAAYGSAFERFYLSVPTGEMFNWGSFNGAQGALELSAFFLLLDCPGFTTEGRIAYLDHLCAIADDAWDNCTSQWSQMGLGPEGHNWYLHGSQVLPFIGLLFPEFKRSRFFLRTGAGVFEEHLRGHYRADGGARETTLGYQAGSMRSLWDFYLITTRNGYPLSPRFAERLLKATRFLLDLMSPDGTLPSFGDTHPSPGSLTALAARAAALTGDGVCKWFAERCRTCLADGGAETSGQIPLSAFWGVGLAGAATYAETRERDPGLVSVLMGDTGYAAMRSSAAADASYLAVAAANRGPIVTSHGHNDVFALDVHTHGARFIGEEGCAPYGESAGREYDERTEAHSCLAIEGMEQAPLAGEWRWRGHVIPAVRRWISTPTHDFFHGVHEGYYRYPEHQTLHARKVLFVKSEPSYWIVFDWLESNVENDVSVYFHGCVEGALSDQTILLGMGGAPRLAIFPPVGEDLVVEAVSSQGLTAYVTEKNIDPKRYPCFRYRKRTTSNCLVWALVPLAEGRDLPAMVRLPVSMNGRAVDPHEATAVELSFGEFKDAVCVSHTEYDATLESGAASTWGIISFTRTAADGSRVFAFEHTVSDGICGR